MPSAVRLNKIADVSCLGSHRWGRNLTFPIFIICILGISFLKLNAKKALAFVPDSLVSMSLDTTESATATTLEVHDSIQTLPPQALAKIKLNRASQPEASCSDDATSGFDSDYPTAQSTPDKSGLQDEETFTHVEHARAISFFPRRRTMLRPFNKEISQSAHNRFADLLELFGEPLRQHLQNSKVRHGPISIKLKVIGENEANAEPWIIVLCDKSIGRKVKQFFDQPQVKTEYQSTDLSVPSFKILVESRPLRPVTTTSRSGASDSAASESRSKA